MWVDRLFKDNLKLLVSQPWEDVKRPHYNDGENVKVKRLLQVCNQYDLRREFPISTIRPLNLKGCIGEAIWIWQKRSVDCDKLGLKIWDQWKDEDNRIPGCYGDMVDRYVVMSKTQDFNEWKPITLESLCSVFGNVDIIGNKVVGYGLLNQTDYILWCLKNDPSSRRIVASMFLPEMNALKPLEECAFQINLSVKGNELYMTLYQRSLDMVTANFWNVAQYAALMMMFAHDAGLKPAVLTHFIQDMHLYDRHEKVAEELLKRRIEGPIAQVSISTRMQGKGFYDFTPDDFEIWNYEPQPQVKFEVAV